jgi:hypothetical protein
MKLSAKIVPSVAASPFMFAASHFSSIAISAASTFPAAAGLCCASAPAIVSTMPRTKQNVVFMEPSPL